MTSVLDDVASMFRFFPNATSKPSRRVLAPSVAVVLGAELAAVGHLPLGSIVLGLLLIHPLQFLSCSTFVCILAMDCFRREEDGLAMTPEVPLYQIFKHSLYSSRVALSSCP